MKKRLGLVIGILAGSLAIALPAQASQELPAGAFVLAKRSADDGGRYEDRADDRRRSDSRSSQRRDGDDRGYGYGYERRQRGGEAADDSRRDRGQDDRRDRRDSRDSRGGDRR